MRGTLKRFSALKAAAESYVEYLRHSDRELPSLHDIFPKSRSIDDVAKFHSQLCTTMKENGYATVGIKVLPPSCEAVSIFRGTQPICVPVFSLFCDKTSSSISVDRLQYVEASICVEVEQLLSICETVNAAATRCIAFAPCIEATGSRFPFYSPSLSGLACDLGECSVIKKGNLEPITENVKPNLSGHRFVLTLNGEPIQVGCGRNCMEGPFAAVAAASAYAKQIGAPLDKKSLVFCGGACPRTPVQAGIYSVEWGVYGRVSASIVD